MSSPAVKPNPPPKEDTWAFQPIGAPFPEDPVKCLGQQNMYCALWYKHGKPIHGRAWNNGGVVECSFPFVVGAQKNELTGAKDLGGQIQVLQYKGDHNTQGFWYEWIRYKDRFDNMEHRQIVHCGDSIPLLWKDRPEGALFGYVDNKTEQARFSHSGKVEELSGGALSNMYIIVRNTKGGPPFCECGNCPKAPPPPPGKPPPRVMFNEWMDIRYGDPWPTRALVQALNKPLDTLPGQDPNQYVALWYQAGEPVMGRVWNENGKVAASFGWFNNEYNKNVGSLQLLVQLSEHVRGYDYSWVPFKEAVVFGEQAKTYEPVHVDHHKGNISPAVIVHQGKQILGKVDVRNERATVGYGGKENIYVGPAVHSAFVLCRRAKEGYKFD